MTGKEKCRLLRQIRREIAETNQISYFPTECTYLGDDCKGTCPMCEAEARYLDKKLNEKVAKGEAITVSGISLNTFQAAAPTISPPDRIPVPDHPMGVMIAEDRRSPRQPLMGIPASPDWERETEDTDFSTLDLSGRSKRILRRAGIETAAQLIAKSPAELAACRGMTGKQLQKILEEVHSKGLYCKGELP